MKKPDVASLNEHNLKIVYDMAERIENELNLLPATTNGIKVKDPEKDVQALEYLQSLGAIKSYTEKRRSLLPEIETTIGFEVTLIGKDFDETYLELKARIGIKMAPSSAPAISKITFPNNSSTLVCDGIKVDIPPGPSLPFYILKHLFSAQYPHRASIEDVIAEWGGTENKGTVRDAITTINERVRAAFHTDDKRLSVVRQSNGYFCFNEAYIESISTDK